MWTIFFLNLHIQTLRSTHVNCSKKHYFFIHLHLFSCFLSLIRYVTNSPNFFIHSDFRLGGPSLTHNLQGHWGLPNKRWEYCVQYSMQKGKYFCGYEEQRWVYNLQLARRLGRSRLQIYTSNTHSCSDVSISLVTYVTRLFILTIR